MAVTEQRLTNPAVEDRDPTTARRPRTTESPTWRSVEVETRWTRVLLFSWLIGFAGLVLFEPVPDNPSVPTWAALVSLTYLLALGATLIGLGTRSPWALRASLGTAGAGVILAAACAQTGHHAGAWWAVELAVFGALMAATQVARKEIAKSKV